MAVPLQVTFRGMDPSPPAILVVEDEGLLRWVLAQDLTAAGFRVIEAADAGQALATWAERGEEVAAVLLDLKLPDGGGLGILERIHATRPACPVIVMTAHGTFETESEVLAAGAVALLCKPFDHDAVLGLLRGLVHAGA